MHYKLQYAFKEENEKQELFGGGGGREGKNSIQYSG